VLAVLNEEAPLSDWECRVLSLVAGGMTDREVSNLLDISVHRVRYAVRDAITRLSAHSRTEAVAIAISEGLIRPEHPLS
jgi:DNA-binding NarL/FixJ family response regulator